MVSCISRFCCSLFLIGFLLTCWSCRGVFLTTCGLVFAWRRFSICISLLLHHNPILLFLRCLGSSTALLLTFLVFVTATIVILLLGSLLAVCSFFSWLVFALLLIAFLRHLVFLFIVTSFLLLTATSSSLAFLMRLLNISVLLFFLFSLNLRFRILLFSAIVVLLFRLSLTFLCVVVLVSRILVEILFRMWMLFSILVLLIFIVSFFSLVMAIWKVVLVIFFCRVSNNSVTFFTLARTLSGLSGSSVICLWLRACEFRRSLRAKRNTSLLSNFFDILDVIMAIKTFWTISSTIIFTFFVLLSVLLLPFFLLLLKFVVFFSLSITILVEFRFYKR